MVLEAQGDRTPFDVPVTAVLKRADRAVQILRQIGRIRPQKLDLFAVAGRTPGEH